MANARIASIVIGGAVRLPVRTFGIAGAEAVIELDANTPAMSGETFELFHGEGRFSGTITETHAAGGRTTLICSVNSAARRATGS